MWLNYWNLCGMLALSFVRAWGKMLFVFRCQVEVRQTVWAAGRERGERISRRAGRAGRASPTIALARGRAALSSLPSFLCPETACPVGLEGRKGQCNEQEIQPGLVVLLLCPSQLLTAWTFLLPFSLFAHKDWVLRATKIIDFEK